MHARSAQALLGCFAFLGIFAAFGLSGCTGQPSPARVREPVYQVADGRVLYMDNVPTSTRTVLQKDYTLGARRVARVTEPMLSVKNYTVSDQVVAAVALEDFEQPCTLGRAARATGGSIAASGRSVTGGKPGYKRTRVQVNEAKAAMEQGGEEIAEQAEQAEDAMAPEVRTIRCQDGRLSRVRGQRDERFSVGGSLREGGNLYYLVEFDAGEDGFVYASTDTRGRIKAGDYLSRAPMDTQAAETPLGIPLNTIVTEASLPRDRALFRFEVSETIDPLAPDFQHYSLIYEGTSYDHRGMVYHILYREFRRDGSTVPLFEQSLAFSGETSTVDILGFRIRVHDVNDKQIVYTVQHD